MAAPRNRIGEILVKARVIDELQLRSALAQLEKWGGRLTRVVVEMGLANEDTVVNAISKATGIQRVQLGGLNKDAVALSKVDVGFAEERAIFPVGLRDNGKTLVLAVVDPTDLKTLDEVAARTRLRVVPMVAGDRELEGAILRYYRNLDPTASPVMRDPIAGKSSGDEDEFKIVDMSGKTVMKRLADIDPRLAQPPPEAAPPPPPPPAAPGASAGDLLDEILSGPPPAPAGFTEEEMQRLRVVQANQEKSSKILRALLELLLEKGALSQRELAAKMRS